MGSLSLGRQRMAGIQYMGLPGISRSCKHAVHRLLMAGDRITQAWLLTADHTHAFLLHLEPQELIAVKSGFSSGYAGEGPGTLADTLAVLEKFGAEIEEITVNAALLQRLDASALTQGDLDSLQKALPVRPVRWPDYVHENGGRQRGHALSHMPSAMPWSLIDPRLQPMALAFEDNPDHALMSGFRHLEDLVRTRVGREASEGRILANAFVGDKSKLTWRDISPGEHSARGQLFTGAYGAFRNPRAHRLGHEEAAPALQEFLLLNLLYTLEGSAIERPPVETPCD